MKTRLPGTSISAAFAMQRLAGHSARHIFILRPRIARKSSKANHLASIFPRLRTQVCFLSRTASRQVEVQNDQPAPGPSSDSNPDTTTAAAKNSETAPFPAPFPSSSSATTRHSVYIKNLPFNVTHDQLMLAFSKFGTVLDTRLLWKDKKANKLVGSGFVDFADAESAKAAIEANEQIILGDRILGVQPAKGKQRVTSGSGIGSNSDSNSESESALSTSPPSRTLYVSIFGPSLSSDELRAHFNNFAFVKRVRGAVPGRNYAHVEFADEQEAKKAFESESVTKAFGRTLRLDYAEEKRKPDRVRSRRVPTRDELDASDFL